MAVPTPLTTIFTPAPSCLSQIHWGTDAPYFQLGPGTQCIPSGVNPSLSSFYSPGLYCPEGYTVACSTEVTSGSATETRATCCPQATGLGTLSVSPFACQNNTLFFATSYGCALGLGNLASNSLTVIATNVSTFTSTFSVGVLDGINAFSVQIRWQESDLTDISTSTSQLAAASTGALSTTLSGPASTTSGSVASATSAAASASSSGSTSSGSRGLSTGAIAAIAVVIPIVVIAALVGLFFFMRRKKRAELPAGDMKDDTPAHDTKHTIPVHDMKQSEPIHEMPAGHVGHTTTNGVPASELDSTPMYEAGSDKNPAIMKG